MKKKMTLLFAAAVLLATTTFAKENPDVPVHVQRQFSQMFANPTSVQWERVKDFSKVTFIQTGQHLTAYFNALGEFESVSRNITTQMLPLMLQSALQEKLQNAWVSEAFEVSGSNGTRYYVTVQNADEDVVLYSTDMAWSVYKRTQK